MYNPSEDRIEGPVYQLVPSDHIWVLRSVGPPLPPCSGHSQLPPSCAARRMGAAATLDGWVLPHPLLSLGHGYHQLLFPRNVLAGFSSTSNGSEGKVWLQGLWPWGDLVKEMGRPLANSSLSCQLPVVSQCPLGRWGISCSWRATGPRRVGGRDAYRVGVWKRRREQVTGAGVRGRAAAGVDVRDIEGTGDTPRTTRKSPKREPCRSPALE